MTASEKMPIEDEATALARLTCYRVFSHATADPLSGRWDLLREPEFQRTASAAADLLRDEAAALPAGAPAPGERPISDLRFDRLLQLLPPQDEAVRAHQRIFGFLLAKDCPPYETEYCPQTFTIYRTHQMADVAGFYRAFGLEPGRDFPERPDHVSLELEYVAWVVGMERQAADSGAGERRQICVDAQKRFVTDHLAWWVPAFCKALRSKAEGISAFHETLAGALSAFVGFERRCLGVPVPTELVAANPAEEEEEMTCEGCELAGGPPVGT